MESYNRLFPDRPAKRLQHFQYSASQVGYKLLREQMQAINSVNKKSKDVLSVLSEWN
jgi:hypothetical protein